MEPIQNQCFNNERGTVAGKRCGQWRPVGAVRTPGAGTDPWAPRAAWTDPPPIAITGVAYRGRQASTHCHYRRKLLGSQGSP